MVILRRKVQLLLCCNLSVLHCEQRATSWRRRWKRLLRSHAEEDAAAREVAAEGDAEDGAVGEEARPNHPRECSLGEVEFAGGVCWFRATRLFCRECCFVFNFLHVSADLQVIVFREALYDKALIERYRKALDTTVKIATVHNIDPIAGTTIIFCNLGYGMNKPCTAARGLGKPRMVCCWPRLS